ncbi:PSD1 and planctomycete cytochrome C domain-containing protein [Rubinisphaera sp.]|uniref:PSD1 and planctomycete cytochrome C domain-containing protein n=1 Tax=Rubinisphaera sp. TaxID=2024857 RepID=UPI000C11C350|nr:PSD1 and planctomycete cytochrome C domain-containing protein [Rubinisphaera sp.]MBV11074.1 hypothetical protein [Rubinisphaera sp.]
MSFRLLLAFGILISLKSSIQAKDIDFNRDIRPLLSDKCYFCHGPDEETREADLRLDQRGAAIEYGAIVPGKPSESLILERITSSDPDLKMPPPSSGKSLSEAEIETFRKWIENDAPYSEHWSFVPPQRPELPASPLKAELQNPIDHFIAAKLDENQLAFSPPADKETLLRRLSLDLIGLPPSPEEIAEFLSATDENAQDQVIERLLNSPHFGEHWGRWWLDAARYADSDGYEKDKQREVWFYRDWVINSLNENKPYNEFIIEQIAGDLLPQASQDEIVATGFLRNSMVNEEGGADPEQFRVEGMFDRMDAIGKAILGLTTQCAQCHTHKFDPITQTDYYRMYAALNDFHEAITTVYTPEQQEQRKSVLDQISQIKARIKQQHPDWKQQLENWADQTREHLVTWKTVTPTEVPYEGQKFRILEDGSVLSESYAPTKSNVELSQTLPAQEIRAVRLDLLTHPQLPHNGPGRSLYGTGALTEFEVHVAPASDPGKKTKVKFTRAFSNVNATRSALPAAFREKNADKDDRVTGPIEYAIDDDKKTAWTSDLDPGRRNENAYAVFMPETPINFDEDFVLTWKLAQLHGGWNSDDNQSYIFGRYRFSVTNGDLTETDPVPLAIRKLLSQPEDQLSDEQQETLFSYWRSINPEYSAENAEIEALWKSHPAPVSQLAVKTMKSHRKTHLMQRGDFLNPGNEVQPGAPDFLNPFQDTPAPDRLDFARWLVSKDSPTTARTIVNRIWQAYFGRGIVSTPEDLGSQSPPPSHPELLDWLAVELMEHNWELKHIHKLIVTSKTYQQSSIISPELLEKDPFNILLARGARFRVRSEVVRDIALTASGLLNRQIGGPSVYPPAPKFLFQPPASYGPKQWPLSSQTQQYRRSLYIHQYRSVPYPPLQVFDSPKGDASCVRRTRSNTPLQALVMLNEPQFVDFAKAFAKRILTECDIDDAERIQYAFQLAVSREADEEEVEILESLLKDIRQRIESGELSSQEINGNSTEVDQHSEAKELAAWSILARAILNLDETITRQ